MMPTSGLAQVAARGLLALFACTQLSPLGLSWCHTADGAVHAGCACSTCQVIEDVTGHCQDACCAKRTIALVCQHDSSSSVPAMTSRPASECCEHVAMQYAPQSASLRTPERSSTGTLTTLPLLQPLLLASSPVHSELLSRGKAPPWIPAEYATTAVTILPLRI